MTTNRWPSAETSYWIAVETAATKLASRNRGVAELNEKLGVVVTLTATAVRLCIGTCARR